MKSILLVGHSGSYNKGCEAIVRSSIQIINQHIDNARYDLVSDDPESDALAMDKEFPNLHLHRSWPEYPDRYTYPWIVNCLCRRIMNEHPRNYLFYKNRKLYKNCDVVISIGGDLFTDDYYGGPKYRFRELEFARSLGKPTVIWAASIGPFKDSSSAKQWADVLKKVNLITIRENETMEYLRTLGVKDNVVRVADPAYLLPAKVCTLPYNKSAENRIIGVGISALFTKFDKSKDEYLITMIEFVKDLLKDDKNIVILVPHVNGYKADQNDSALCDIMAEKINSHHRAIVADHRLNAVEMKYLISQCEYFIGARMHSLIAALSSSVPTLSLAYSSKAYGINIDIFGHIDYVISRESLSLDILVNKFNKLVSREAEVKGKLNESIPKIQRMSVSGGSLLVKLLNDRR